VAALPKGLRLAVLTSDDGPEVQTLAEACPDYFLETFGLAPGPAEAQSLFTALPDGRSYDDKRVLGIRDPAGKLLAVADVVRGWPDGQTWMIGLLLVVPAARRKGIGGRFVEDLARQARQAGARRLRLGVFVDRQAAMRFWERHGFEPAGMQLRETDLGERELVVMVRDLAERGRGAR
jgi:GNAT superfamily N-acetyltransferase